jgi:hypothetical protein
MIERYKAEDLLKCVKCKNLYIENENKMGMFMSQTCLNKIHYFISDSCVHHDGFVFVNEGPEFEIYTPSQVATILRKLERKITKYPDRHEEFERQKKNLNGYVPMKHSQMYVDVAANVASMDSFPIATIQRVNN